MCLFQTIIWISNVIWCGIICVRCCIEVIVRFVDIDGIVVHHCLKVIVCFVDIGGIVVHHCLNFLYIIIFNKLM